MKEDIFNLTNYTYDIPAELIAQEPLPDRTQSRLLVIDRASGTFRESVFKEAGSLFRDGDVLVINNTRVIRARLKARRETGGSLEVLLLRDRGRGLWEVLVKPGKKARQGDTLFFSPDGSFSARVLERTDQGGRVLQFSPQQILPMVEKYGKVPAPPYIKKEVDDADRYQTVYASREGAVAAPTAGFHFTPELLAGLEKKGVKIVYVTLHCGLPTFRPVKTEDIRDHDMEREMFELDRAAAEVINSAKKEGRRIIAVGTTSIRTLESAAIDTEQGFEVAARTGETRLYIYPGYEFKIIDAIITNFHTPCSTNLVLISAFAGLKLIQDAYCFAREKKFRFFSFGDSMCII